MFHPTTDAHIATCAICHKRAADAVVAIFNESKGRGKDSEPNFLTPEDISDNTFRGAGIVITKAQMTEAIKIFKKNMRQHGKAT